MKKNVFTLNILLTVAVLIALAVMLLVKTFQPAAVLPVINIPNMVLLGLIALLADHYLCKDSARNYWIIGIFSLLTYALLPWAAGFADLSSFWKYGVIGGAVFTALTWLFTSMTDRLSTGPKAHAALIAGCLGIYLAFQALTGILL